MTQHAHHHPAGPVPADPFHDDSGLADLLDLDAEVFGSFLDELTGWVAQRAPGDVRTVLDLGAGTGTGTLALARRFPAAEMIAIDNSPLMLDRLRAAAAARGLGDRLRVLPADLDAGWPELDGVDVLWAASSLHHLADPDRVLRDAFTALRPGGVLVAVEMDELPRFLPDDVGVGRPGLEARCHEAMAEEHWNAHPDWRPHLERAGFPDVEQQTFTLRANPAPPGTGRYAQIFLSRVRAALHGRLAPDDLDTLDHLLAEHSPGSLRHRPDLTVSGSRTAWAARRP